MKMLILVALFAATISPCLSDVTGLYVENSPTEVSRLQLAQTDNTIDGSIEVISVSSNSPGYIINNANLSGTAHGSNVFLRVDNGWLGKSTLLSGKTNGKELTIDVPQPDGHLDNARFRLGSAPTWNKLVTAFEMRMRKGWTSHELASDYSSTVAEFNSRLTNMSISMSALESAVSDMDVAHLNEARCEVAVDKANAAANQSKDAMDKVQSDMNALQAAMNTDQAEENAHQSDREAFQKAEEEYQSNEKAYQADTDKYQIDMNADQTATTKLYSVSNSSASSLWKATDTVWQDIAKITQLHNEIVADEAQLRVLYDRAANDRQEILQMVSPVKAASLSGKAHFPSRSEFSHGLDQFDAKLLTVMPKTLAPLSSFSGTVIVDSAAVRNYNPDNGSLHTDVNVLGTLERGQRINSIKGQTFNDFVIQLSNGEIGIISKADVQLDTGQGLTSKE